MKGITVSEALQIMQNNQGRFGTFLQNEQTAKAARTLMGAYKTTNSLKHCVNLRTAISFFSKLKPKAQATFAQQDNLKEYQIVSCGHFDYFVMRGTKTYINCDGNEINECYYSAQNGAGGHFKSMQSAVEAAKKHKAKRELAVRSFTIERRAKDTGDLYSNVWESDIAIMLNKAGFDFVSHASVVLPKSLKQLGMYTVLIRCFGTSIPIRLWIVPTAF